MSSLFTIKSSFISPCIINQQAFFLNSALKVLREPLASLPVNAS